MSTDGLSNLDKRITTFEELLAEMREATRDAHSALKQLRHERRDIDRLLSGDVKAKVEARVDEVVKTELDKIGPEMRRHTNALYDRVGQEVDKLIDLSLGKEFSHIHGREDTRPALAAKLRIWLREIIDVSEGDDE